MGMYSMKQNNIKDLGVLRYSIGLLTKCENWAKSGAWKTHPI